jgi:methyl-accepting chemotaxis protein
MKIKLIISEITTASEEQARGVAQVNTAIETVETVTQANASASEELAASSEELSSQSITVNDLVGDLVGVIYGGDSKSKRLQDSRSKFANSHKTAQAKTSMTQKSLPHVQVKAKVATTPAAANTLIPFEDDQNFGEY